MHGGAVKGCRRHGVEAKSVRDRGGLRGTSLFLVVGRENLDRFLLGACDSDREAVEHQAPRGRDRRGAEIAVVGGDDAFAQLRGHGDGGSALRFRRCRLGVRDAASGDESGGRPGDVEEPTARKLHLALPWLAHHGRTRAYITRSAGATGFDPVSTFGHGRVLP